MKNINLDILLNIGNYKNSFSSNLESIHDKVSSNYMFQNSKNSPSIKYMKQSLTKFHRPFTTKVKSQSINRHKKNVKNNEFIKPIPIFYNGNLNKEKNNSSGIYKKAHDYTSNLLNTTKIISNQKINGKNLEELFMKNITSLPEIKEENNLIKKSISIINKTKERVLKVNNQKNPEQTKYKPQAVVLEERLNTKKGIPAECLYTLFKDAPPPKQPRPRALKFRRGRRRSQPSLRQAICARRIRNRSNFRRRGCAFLRIRAACAPCRFGAAA